MVFRRLALIGLTCGVLAFPPVVRSGDRTTTGDRSTTGDGAAPAAKANELPPATPQAIDASIRRGVEFLLQRQNKDGSWGSAHNTKGLNIYAPVPGAHDAFRTAVTALCLSSLIEIGGDERVTAAVDRGEAWMFANVSKLRRADGTALYNNWGHAYAIDGLVHMLGRRPNDAERNVKIRELIRSQIDRLQRYECVDGGWAYYDFGAQTQRPSGSSISFVTATGLVALDAAKHAGVEVPQRLVDRAKASILRQRKPDFSYDYGEYLKYRPMHPVNRPGGSLGRSQACNLAMRLWGDTRVTDAVLKDWLERLLDRNLWLDIGRKRPIPHESWFKVAGYFFYYGHYYAARCIEELPSADRPEFKRRLAQIILHVQDGDGSWWDFPLYDYHQQYGTAFALMTLQRCK